MLGEDLESNSTAARKTRFVGSPSPPCVGRYRKENIPDKFKNVNFYEKIIYKLKLSRHQYLVKSSN